MKWRALIYGVVLICVVSLLLIGRSYYLLRSQAEEYPVGSSAKTIWVPKNHEFLLPVHRVIAWIETIFHKEILLVLPGEIRSGSKMKAELQAVQDDLALLESDPDEQTSRLVYQFDPAETDHYNPEKEPAKSFRKARELLKNGQFEEAHNIHLRMFDHIEECRPESFFLTIYNLTYDWHQVGLNHPPAMEALIARRDQRSAWLLAEGKDLSSDIDIVIEKGVTSVVKVEGYLEQKICIHEISSINEWLGEHDKTVALYQQLRDKIPRFARSVRVWVKDALIAEGKQEMPRGE